MPATNDASLTSWLDSANAGGCDFPVQNLPFGVFSRIVDGPHRIGVAIGDQVLDLAACVEHGLLEDPHAVLTQSTLNGLMSLGRDAWQRARGPAGVTCLGQHIAS